VLQIKNMPLYSHHLICTKNNTAAGWILLVMHWFMHLKILYS